MFADDIVVIPFGGREVNMTEYTWIRGKITRRERWMRVIRLKTQLMDFAFEQNEYGNRKPMKIIGEELERVTRFKCIGTSTEEKCCMATEITVRMGPGWRNWKKCRGVLCAEGCIRNRSDRQCYSPWARQYLTTIKGDKTPLYFSVSMMSIVNETVAGHLGGVA